VGDIPRLSPLKGSRRGALKAAAQWIIGRQSFLTKFKRRFYLEVDMFFKGDAAQLWLQKQNLRKERFTRAIHIRAP